MRRWRAAGWPISAIARRLHRSPTTIKAYLAGKRRPGPRTPSRPDTFGPFVDYARRRFADDPHLGTRALFAELAGLGYPGSYPTFCRALQHHRARPARCQACQQPPPGSATSSASALLARRPVPLPVPLVAGEVLASYLGRLAAANHVTVADVLSVLPPWFRTKVRNHDDRNQHHLLAPTTSDALRALAAITGAPPAALARALPAFGGGYLADPVRATIACRRCLAVRGIHQPVPVHLPACHQVCTRHGRWLATADLPQLDLAACPEVIHAQHRARRLLRRFSPEQLLLAYLTAARALHGLPRPPSRAAADADALAARAWRHRLRRLKATNPHVDHTAARDEFVQAAIYPDAIHHAAAALSARHR